MAQQEHIVESCARATPRDLAVLATALTGRLRHAGRAVRKAKAPFEKPAERNAVVEELPIRRDSGFRAWLPIMYGCDNFCTYCIVPYVRGRERSREPAAILAEFRQLVEQGYKEITRQGCAAEQRARGWNIPSTLPTF